MWMLIPDVLSQYSPELSDEVQLDLSIHHMHITLKYNADVQQAIHDYPLSTPSWSHRDYPG